MHTHRGQYLRCPECSAFRRSLSMTRRNVLKTLAGSVALLVLAPPAEAEQPMPDPYSPRRVERLLVQEAPVLPVYLHPFGEQVGTVHGSVSHTWAGAEWESLEVGDVIRIFEADGSRLEDHTEEGTFNMWKVEGEPQFDRVWGVACSPYGLE